MKNDAEASAAKPQAALDGVSGLAQLPVAQA
jgi:hypothetical protein